MAPKQIETGDNRTRGQLIAALVEALEAAKQVDADGAEYWSARTLASLLGYKRWENFETAIGRARAACGNVGEEVSDHFRDVTKMVQIGSGASRETSDCELTRFAAYLVAMNGDPGKDEIAAAQAYFAVQTRRQELIDEAQGRKPALTEDERRVLIRDELKEHNKSLASTAKAHGVRKRVDYAVFQNEGYKGLYGGFDMRGIRRRRGLSGRQDILDHMPSAELAANMFRATQTQEKLEKLRRDGKVGKAVANQTHFDIGKKVRDTIEEIGGTMPEDYDAVEHVQEARRRVEAEEKKRLG
jgi:DNA-damage-inducible protein D